MLGVFRLLSLRQNGNTVRSLIVVEAYCRFWQVRGWPPTRTVGLYYSGVRKGCLPPDRLTEDAPTNSAPRAPAYLTQRADRSRLPGIASQAVQIRTVQIAASQGFLFWISLPHNLSMPEHPVVMFQPPNGCG